MTDEQIITAIGFDDASDELKKQVLESIRLAVDIRVGAIVGEYLTPEQSEEFDRLQQAGDDETIWKWLREEVMGVDMREVYEATLQSYLEEMQEKVANLK
jgi:hypothetical protein